MGLFCLPLHFGSWSVKRAFNLNWLRCESVYCGPKGGADAAAMAEAKKGLLFQLRIHSQTNQIKLVLHEKERTENKKVKRKNSFRYLYDEPRRLTEARRKGFKPHQLQLPALL